LLNEVEIEDIEEITGRDLQEEFKDIKGYVREYNLYNKAREIGVVFSPSDLTIEQLEAFYIIEKRINSQKVK